MPLFEFSGQFTIRSIIFQKSVDNFEIRETAIFGFLNERNVNRIPIWAII